jgi:hypothetical protein
MTEQGKASGAAAPGGSHARGSSLKGDSTGDFDVGTVKIIANEKDAEVSSNQEHGHDEKIIYVDHAPVIKAGKESALRI